MMVVYMQVTKDDYELPVAVADSITELAEILGCKASRIYCSMHHAKKRGHRTPYVKVEIGECE